MKSGAERLELNKILEAVSSFCVLEEGKARILACEPTENIGEAKRLLDLTEEARLLLFELGSGSVEAFSPLGDIPARAEKGASLSCAELLLCARLLRSARIFYESVRSFSDERIVLMRELAERILPDSRLEEEIGEKILSDTEISDHASEKLFSLRTQIRQLGERIRARLQGYLSGDERRFLQDGIVTVRGDRFVIPVKAEYKRSIKGFVHDRSATGQTVFVEPEEVLELNNELKSLSLDEKEEEARILAELSRAVGRRRSAFELDAEVLSEADGFYARAEYAHALSCVRPELNAKGIVEIVKGRHPLLDRKTAVPVSLSVGEKYRFLIISGANTGGKTVTLKMCGLFCLMAACGLFVPAASARLAVFDGVYCDVGDSQSIEENLSTFSSHIVNLRDILHRAGEKSLVLIDEPGGGTDPAEGQALARAILVALLKKGCRGIVTTHYSALKEFAYAADGAENGCMEFDEEDFRPLFRLKIGAPGSSNALAICSRLGLDEEVISSARAFLPEGARAYERTIRAAEEGRIRAEKERAEAEAIKAEWKTRLSALEGEEEKFRREREKFLSSSKAEARRIVADRTAQAEELLKEIEEIFKKENLSESDLIRARTLKNKISASRFEEEERSIRRLPVDPAALKEGDFVYLAGMDAEGRVLSVRREKKTAEVQVGALKVRSAFSDLYTASPVKREGENVQVFRRVSPRSEAKTECMLIGLTVPEALIELENFLDAALVAGLSTVRIVHGMGKGKLRAAVQDALRKNARVAEYRLGKYGEGESGVTIVTFK